MRASKKVRCPLCEENFELEDDLGIGDTTYCPGCYAELKVVMLDPSTVEEVDFSGDYDYKEDNEEDDYEEGH